MRERGGGVPVGSEYLKSLSWIRTGELRSEHTEGVVHDEGDDRGSSGWFLKEVKEEE